MRGPNHQWPPSANVPLGRSRYWVQLTWKCSGSPGCASAASRADMRLQVPKARARWHPAAWTGVSTAILAALCWDLPPPSDLEPSDRLATTRVGKPPLRSASCKSSPGWRPTLPSSRKCLGRGDAPGSERSGGGMLGLAPSQAPREPRTESAQRGPQASRCPGSAPRELRRRDVRLARGRPRAAADSPGSRWPLPLTRNLRPGALPDASPRPSTQSARVHIVPQPIRSHAVRLRAPGRPSPPAIPHSGSARQR